jgi:cytochrome c553
MKKIILASLALMFASSAIVHAAGDAEAGKTKAAACGGCHGMDGNSAVPTFPKLASQGEKYIVKQLQDFKANANRKNELMLGMAAALSEEDMADIGAFYAVQKLAGSAPHDESKLEQGRQIYKGGDLTKGRPACQSCHGPKGGGIAGSGYPQLGGQFVDYTLAQLKAFRDGTRMNDDKMLMRSIVKDMTDEELEAVSNYIASLQY